MKEEKKERELSQRLEEIKQNDRIQSSRTLITKYGCFNIQQKRYMKHTVDFHPFRDFGAFQLYNKLYLCGGTSHHYS